jgi:hypothetical protein
MFDLRWVNIGSSAYPICEQPYQNSLQTLHLQAECQDSDYETCRFLDQACLGLERTTGQIDFALSQAPELDESFGYISISSSIRRVITAGG